MPKRIFLILSAIVFTGFLAGGANAQSPRKSVSAAEVNGTFRSYFKGKFRGSFNEIKIFALGKGKLKIAFDLTYPFVDGTGGLMANVGQADGTAEIEGDTAVYSSEESGRCRIIIKFVRPGIIKVTQDEEMVSCGFGLNVSANGAYKKVSAGKPKFGQ